MGLFNFKTLFAPNVASRTSSGATSAKSVGGCEWTFRLKNGDSSITLDFDVVQDKLYRMRLSREFKGGKRVADIKKLIKGARTLGEVAVTAEQNGICDICDFEGINLNAAKITLKAVLDAEASFPILRSRVCFLGTDTAYLKYWRTIKENDKAVLSKFGIMNIWPQEEIEGLVELCEYGGLVSERNLASAFSSAGFTDGIILKAERFTDKNYSDTLSSLSIDAQSGVSPVGCSTLKALIDHEVGHLLDYYYKISERRCVVEYYKSLSPERIKNELSEYAAKDICEFVAEAYSEYKNSEHPRKIAMTIGKEVG